MDIGEHIGMQVTGHIILQLLSPLMFFNRELGLGILPGQDHIRTEKPVTIGILEG